MPGMDIRSLIAALGGPSKVASDLGTTPQAVANWATDGKLPAGRELDVWILARRAGVDWRPPGREGVHLMLGVA